MRVPLSWLHEMVDFDLEPEDLAARLTLLGMEVKGIERVGSGWTNVVVGELLEVGPHPNSSRLSLTRVNVGGDGPALSIVCGATNIAVGQRVPVAVPGALLSAGDPHASQGDSELCGTAIECSLTGTFQIILHKKATLEGTSLAGLDYPLLETQDEWLMHGFSYANYLQELGEKAQSTIYEKSSVDLALKDAFRKMRAFLMNTKGLSEDEAISLMSIAVDFGITQVVDGNWGVHAILKKSIFAGAVA